jgi:hypothetical protein
MEPENYVPPRLNGQGFHCPHCGVYADQVWEEIFCKRITGVTAVPGWRSASCGHCKDFSLWRSGMMVYPAQATAPVSAVELHDDKAGDKAGHDKARGMVALSARNAATLFQICVQKLRKRA